MKSIGIDTFELRRTNSKKAVDETNTKKTIFATPNMLTLGLLTLFLYASFSSLVIQKSDYILLKAASILIIPLVIQFLSIEDGRLKKNKPISNRFTGVTALITVVILITNINSIYELRSHSTYLSRGNLVKTWDQSSTTGCLYLFNLRGQEDSSLRYVDRTVDYLMESVFRGDVVLDPWTNQSLARPVDVKNLENQKVCLALRGNNFDRYRELGYNEIFRDESWLVLDTQMTYKEIVEKFGVLENFQTSIRN